MTLTTIDNIKQELRVDEQGRGWVSISGAARLAGVTQPALSMSFDRYKKNSSKLARFLTQQGFNPISFSETGVPDVALVFLLEFYAFHSNAKNDVALLNFRSISAVGARTLIRQACGWNDQAMSEDELFARAILAADNKIKKLESRVEQLEEITDELFGYSSIIRVAKMNDISEKTFDWRLLKKASINLGLEIKSATCPRYGKKNLYPHAAWEYCYPDVLLPTAPLSIA